VKYQNVGLVAAMPLFLGGLSCLLGGALSHWLVRRTGRKRLFRALFPMFGATTAAVAIFGVKSAQTPFAATVLLCVAAAAFDFGQAANWATIVDLGGKYAGSAAGLVNLVGNLGNAFQPFIGAMIFGAFGWNALFAVYAVAYLVAASMWLFIDPTKPFDAGLPDAAPAAFEALPVAEAA
jgi:nitrate/nitrite transporter NarK